MKLESHCDVNLRTVDILRQFTSIVDKQKENYNIIWPWPDTYLSSIMTHSKGFFSFSFEAWIRIQMLLKLVSKC